MRRILPLLLLAGCSEYGMFNPGSTQDLGPDRDNPFAPPTEVADDLPPHVDRPPDHPTPSLTLDHACDPDQLATFDSEQIWVGSTTRTSDEGVLYAPEAGWYDLYNTHLAESGASQLNESTFFRVRNDSNPRGWPLLGNCGDAWVVVDSDNLGPAPGVQEFVGTFWFDAGENLLEMTHYCTLYRAGMCPEHHTDTPSNQTCDSNNIHSAHFMGFAICLVPVD